MRKEVDNVNSDNTMLTRQDKTRQDKTDKGNRFTESDKGLSGQSESVQYSGHMSCDKSNGLQRPTEDLRKVGVICCKLNKMPEGKLTSLDDAKICDIGTLTASTVTSRYYKGIGSHKDNMVLEIWKKT